MTEDLPVASVQAGMWVEERLIALGDGYVDHYRYRLSGPVARLRQLIDQVPSQVLEPVDDEADLRWRAVPLSSGAASCPVEPRTFM